MHHPNRATHLLAAGAYLPIDAALPEDAVADAIDARVYRHSSLGERVVIRLTPEALALGEDSNMEFFGFGPGVARVGVAMRRRQSLGFPQWVLVHDPDNAAKAIEVGKKLRAQAPVAKVKPGAAKKALEKLGDELEATLPHFLPSYYEEVGRAFLEAGNAGFAGVAFGKAREAEQVYGLEIEEDHRRQTFVEFALAGALTNKVMSDYAKDLSRRYGDVRGYEIFFDVCLRRSLAGTAPQKVTVDLLRRLAKAAGLDPQEQDERFVREVWHVPSLVAKSWQLYPEALIALAKEDPAIRGRLLNLFPKPDGPDDNFKRQWIEFLDACGALDSLTMPAADVPSLAAPEGGAASWFGRLWDQSTNRVPIQPDALFDLLRRMAARLVQDGAPIPFNGDSQYASADIDLVDLAVELGVEVACHRVLNLRAWATPPKGSNEHPRELRFVCASAAWQEQVDRAVTLDIDHADFQKAAPGCAALVEPRRRWLQGHIAGLTSGAWPDFESSLSTLRAKATPELYLEFATAHDALSRVEPITTIARTFRNGLLDEYAWPAFEEVHADYIARNSRASRVQIEGVFPYLIVHDNDSATVIGAEGVVYRHDFQLPKRAKLRWLVFIGGQLLVGFRDDNYTSLAYWSAAPSEHFEAPDRASFAKNGVDLPDNGVTFGRTATYPGDKEFPLNGPFFCDGEHFWKYEQGPECEPVEFDPRRSGAADETGRQSLPTFFEDFQTPEAALVMKGCQLYPVSGAAQSPLGVKDGLYGLRVRRSKDDTTRGEFEGLDGRRFVGRVGRVPFCALVTIPGDDAVRPVWAVRQWCLYEPDGEIETLDQDHCQSPTGLLPYSFWHFVEARDPAGSVRLRAASDADVEKLIAASGQEAVVKEVFPELSDERLIASVSAFIGDIAAKLGEFRDYVAANAPVAVTGPEIPDIEIDEYQLKEVLKRFMHTPYSGDREYEITKGLRVMSAYLFAGKAPKKMKLLNIPWQDCFGLEKALAWQVVTKGLPEEQDLALMGFLELWGHLGYLGYEGRVRTYAATVVDRDQATYLQGLGEYADRWHYVDGDHRYLGTITDKYTERKDLVVFEYSATGEFKTLPGVSIGEAVDVKQSGLGLAEIEAIKALRETRGQIPFDKDRVQAFATSTGLSFAEAALVWMGLPELRNSDKNFLPRELREEMGLKVAEASMAREVLCELDKDKLLAFMDAAFPDDLLSAYEVSDGADTYVQNMVRVWNATFGRKTALPPELVLELDKAFGPYVQVREILPVFIEPESHASFATDYKRHGFGGAFVTDTMRVASYLHGMRPVGDEVRAGASAVRDLVRAGLENEDLLLSFRAQIDVDEEDQDGPITQYWIDQIGGELVQELTYCRIFDNGVIRLLAHDTCLEFEFRPARMLAGETHPAFAAVKEVEVDNESCAANLEVFLRDGMQALFERIETTPVPVGQYEANPLYSVPDLLGEVTTSLDLGEHAAMLFLQTLTLHNPTTALVRTWNDWTAAQYNAAAKELVERELVIEAKRSRAGRKHFIDGAWEPLWAPQLPIESWKLPLYGVNEGGRAPLGLVMALEPLHTLFARAWERFGAGDKPGF